MTEIGQERRDNELSVWEEECVWRHYNLESYEEDQVECDLVP